MKRIWTLLISIMMLIGLSGCNCNDKKPPHRALYNKTSNYGMQHCMNPHQMEEHIL